LVFCHLIITSVFALLGIYVETRVFVIALAILTEPFFPIFNFFHSCAFIILAKSVKYMLFI